MIFLTRAAQVYRVGLGHSRRRALSTDLCWVNGFGEFWRQKLVFGGGLSFVWLERGFSPQELSCIEEVFRKTITTYFKQFLNLTLWVVGQKDQFLVDIRFADVPLGEHFPCWILNQCSLMITHHVKSCKRPFTALLLYFMTNQIVVNSALLAQTMFSTLCKKKMLSEFFFVKVLFGTSRLSLASNSDFRIFVQHEKFTRFYCPIWFQGSRVTKYSY